MSGADEHACSGAVQAGCTLRRCLLLCRNVRLAAFFDLLFFNKIESQQCSCDADVWLLWVTPVGDGTQPSSDVLVCVSSDLRRHRRLGHTPALIRHG